MSGNDLMQYWYDDPRTDVVLLYLESFGNPRKFARLARALARRKPVIALKSGRHALVTPGLAASSATVSDSAVATLFAQSGVIRVDTLAEAFDAALLLSHQPVPTGNRVAIIGNSTALGVLALDACLEHGLDGGRRGADRPRGRRWIRRRWRSRCRPRSTTTTSTPWWSSTCRRWPPPGCEHAAALRAAVRDARIPVVSTFLAVQGLPEHLRCLDEDGAAGARLGAVLRHTGAGGGRAGPGGPLRAVARPTCRGGAAARPGMDPDRARGWSTAGGPVDRRPQRCPSNDRVELLDCYGIEVLDYRVARSAARGRRTAPATSGTRWC